MRATWRFRATRHAGGHSWIKRSGGEDTLTGSEREALAFAGEAAKYLRVRSAVTVECWSVGEVEGSPELPSGGVTFRIVLHPNGKDWLAEQSDLHHGGWWADLRQAIDYAIFRGRGRVCAVQVLNKAGDLMRVVLADQCRYRE